MTLRCIDPAVGEALLDDVRPGAAPLRPEQEAHLERCERCRVSVEQLRRLALTWQALEPAPVDTRSARARFLVRGRKRRSRKVVPKAAALVVVLAAAAASAAVRVVVVRLAAPPPLPTLAAADPAPPAVSKRSGPASHRPRARDAGAADEVEALDLDAVPEAGVAEKPPVAEISVDDLPVATAVVTATAPAPAPAPATPTPTPTPTPPPSPWLIAASAMREGDYSRAEAAFNELATSPDASTRDAARLARAQVWVSEGRARRARPELEDLATNGATPLVRKRAADALDALR